MTKSIQSEEVDEVFKAIFVNDFDRLQKIYANHNLGTDILDEHGMTPLQHAAYKGNEQIVRWLLDRVSSARGRHSSCGEGGGLRCVGRLGCHCSFTAGRRRQFRKAQVQVHCFAFRRPQWQSCCVQFAAGCWCQE